MKPKQLLEELKSLAATLNITVRFEQGNFRGGSCILEQQRLIVINRSLPVESKISLLAQALSSFPLDGVYIKPAVREYLEQERLALQQQAGEPIQNGFEMLIFDPLHPLQVRASLADTAEDDSKTQ